MVKTLEEQYKLVFDRLMKLMEKEKLEDTNIYYEGKRYSYDRNKEAIVIEEDMNVSDYIEYNNPNGVTISFEGELYHAINYGSNKPLFNKFENVTKGTEVYYQLGYAWSASFYN